MHASTRDQKSVCSHGSIEQMQLLSVRGGRYVGCRRIRHISWLEMHDRCASNISLALVASDVRRHVLTTTS